MIPVRSKRFRPLRLKMRDNAKLVAQAKQEEISRPQRFEVDCSSKNIYLSYHPGYGQVIKYNHPNAREGDRCIFKWVNLHPGVGTYYGVYLGKGLWRARS